MLEDVAMHCSLSEALGGAVLLWLWQRIPDTTVVLAPVSTQSRCTHCACGVPEDQP